MRFQRDMKLLNLFEGHDTVSIIGMEKNVGKTTVLNAILEECRGRKQVALTSIGRDGEDTDRVTYTHKPKIYVERGTILATAKEALFGSDITREILETTNITTPMGEVIIARALTDGYVDLAGPSISTQISYVRKRMLEYGPELVVIDGALGRMGTFRGDSAVILSTGASLAPGMGEVVGKTLHRIDLLKLEKAPDKILNLYRENSCGERIVFIGETGGVKKVELESVLEADKLIVDELEEGFDYIFIRGAVVPALIERLIKNRHKFEKLNIVAEDGIKLFIDPALRRKANLCGIKFKVCQNINLVGLTCNPVSPFGYKFDSEEFHSRLKGAVNLPVIDVVGGRE